MPPAVLPPWPFAPPRRDDRIDIARAKGEQAIAAVRAVVPSTRRVLRDTACAARSDVDNRIVLHGENIGRVERGLTNATTTAPETAGDGLTTDIAGSQNLRRRRRRCR